MRICAQTASCFGVTAVPFRMRHWIVMLALGIAMTSPAGQARAQVAEAPSPSSTRAEVSGPLAIGPGNRLYVGGWRRVAARTRHFVVFDGSGDVDPAWPEVDGPVHAIVADGAGGWFIGGEFAHVGGQPRAGLANIAAGGALDPAWAPAAGGEYLGCARWPSWVRRCMS